MGSGTGGDRARPAGSVGRAGAQPLRLDVVVVVVQGVVRGGSDGSRNGAIVVRRTVHSPSSYRFGGLVELGSFQAFRRGRCLT